jgi:H2-forming N5,N10-methylenetetrahydromethanopterin dehydrogenase-like enzyme
MAFAKCLANLRSLTLLKSLINNEEHFQIILDNCLANDDEILAKLARVVEKKENDFFNTKKIKYIEQIPNHNAIKKVLDFGGANGAIASAMAERYGFDVVVCDTNIHEQKFTSSQTVSRNPPW